jgi:hypothetical protein
VRSVCCTPILLFPCVFRRRESWLGLPLDSCRAMPCIGVFVAACTLLFSAALGASIDHKIPAWFDAPNNTERRFSTCVAGKYPAPLSSRRLEEAAPRKTERAESWAAVDASLQTTGDTTETTFPPRQSHSRHLAQRCSGDLAYLMEQVSCGAEAMVCAPGPTSPCNVCPVSVWNLCGGSFVRLSHLNCYGYVMNAIGACGHPLPNTLLPVLPC